ncbi:MAG: citrate/2-methylcitrate synthase [Bacteroidota bacterium]
MNEILTGLSEIDGQVGELKILGFPFEEIAANASFEELLFLFLYGDIPNEKELQGLKRTLIDKRVLSSSIIDILRILAKQRVDPIEALRIAVSALSVDMKQDLLEKDGLSGALKIIASVPTIIATYWRLENALPLITPHSELGHTANYLYMLSGEKPRVKYVKALEAYFSTVVEHGTNASTFAARVIISTRSDLVSAVTGSIGALKGILHGGAPSPALEMLLDIGNIQQAKPYLKNKLDNGERLMGFGHRVYRVRDPRARFLGKIAEQIWENKENKEFWLLAVEVEQVALRLLKEYKPGRSIQTNVEYYTALLLHGLGLPTSIFTPTFAVSRVVGWIAHCFEQLETSNIIRPHSRYIGVKDRHWVPHARKLKDSGKVHPLFNNLEMKP